MKGGLLRQERQERQWVGMSLSRENEENGTIGRRQRAQRKAEQKEGSLQIIGPVQGLLPLVAQSTI